MFVVLHDELAGLAGNSTRLLRAVGTSKNVQDNAQKKRVREGECSSTGMGSPAKQVKGSGK